jgi:hypothetical protein
MTRGTRNEYISPWSPQRFAPAEWFGDMYLLRVPKVRAGSKSLGQAGQAFT